MATDDGTALGVLALIFHSRMFAARTIMATVEQPRSLVVLHFILSVPVNSAITVFTVILFCDVLRLLLCRFMEEPEPVRMLNDPVGVSLFFILLVAQDHIAQTFAQKI